MLIMNNKYSRRDNSGSSEEQNLKEAATMSIDHLIESNKIYKDLYYNAPSPFFSVGIDGRIKRVNKRAVELLHASEADLLGKKVLDLYADSPKGKQKARVIFDRFLTGEEIRQEEMEMIDGNGKKITVCLSVSPIVDERGNIIASRSVVEDLTERKEFEKKLIKKEKELIKKNREIERISDLKSEIVAITSHDLRSLLTRILGFASILMDSDIDTDEEKRDYYLKSIIKSGRYIEQLITGILDIESIESGEFRLNKEPVIMVDLLRDTIRTMDFDIRSKNIKIDLEVEGSQAEVNADALKMKQVFGNILSNAIKHSPKNGIVDVRCSCDEEGKTEISICDQGPGIPEKDKNKIFNKYFKVEQSRKNKTHTEGIGLGLYISNKIVEMHEGEIFAKNRPGKGCCFFIRIQVIS